MSAVTNDSLGSNLTPLSSSNTQAKISVILGKMLFVEGASTSRLSEEISGLIKSESVYGQGINFMDIGFRTAQNFKPLAAGAAVEIKRAYDTQLYHVKMTEPLHVKSVMWLDTLQHAELFVDSGVYEMFIGKLLNRLRQTMNTVGYVLMLKLFANKNKLSDLSCGFKFYEKMYDDEFPEASDPCMKEIKGFRDKFKNVVKLKPRAVKTGNQALSDTEQRNLDLIDFSTFIRRRINMLCMKAPQVENTWTGDPSSGSSAKSKETFSSNTTSDNLVVIMAYEDYMDLLAMPMINIGYLDPISRSIVSPESGGVGKIIPLEGMAPGTATIIHKDAVALLPRYNSSDSQKGIEYATTQHVVHQGFRFGYNSNLPGIKIEMTEMKTAKAVGNPEAS